MPVASARPDQNPKEMASQSGPEGPWPTGARWRVRVGKLLFCEAWRPVCRHVGFALLPAEEASGKRTKIPMLTSLVAWQNFHQEPEKRISEYSNSRHSRFLEGWHRPQRPHRPQRCGVRSPRSSAISHSERREITAIATRERRENGARTARERRENGARTARERRENGAKTARSPRDRRGLL